MKKTITANRPSRNQRSPEFAREHHEEKSRMERTESMQDEKKELKKLHSYLESL